MIFSDSIFHSQGIFPKDFSSLDFDGQTPEDACPLMSERRHSTIAWTCEDFRDLDKLEDVSENITIATKSIQTLMFTVLLIMIIHRRVKHSGQIGKLPILVSIFSILNGVFSILRVRLSYQIMLSDTASLSYQIYFFIESVCFFGATWFFSIKYYETANDLRKMLTEDITKTSKLTIKRKRNCKITRWAVFGLIIVAQSAETFAMFYSEDDDPTFYKIMFAVSFSILGISLFTILALMMLAALQFVKIVSMMEQKVALNRCFTVVQITSLSICFMAWLVMGIIIFNYYNNSTDFDSYRMVIITDVVGQIANLLNFLVIAVVIHKSSKVINSRHDPIV